MQITKYLQQAQSLGMSYEALFERLEAEFGITARVYLEDNMVLLDYSMIDSPKQHPLVIECRSLILKLDTFEVLSKKMNRFFNAGECPEYYSDFDLRRSAVMMKYDGSLIGVYFNDFTDRWEISTRGMAKAEGNHPMGGTFCDHVIKALGCTDEEHFQTKMNAYVHQYGHGFKSFTLVMEYCSEWNRVVTPYKDTKMVLITMTSYEQEYDLGYVQSEADRLFAFGFNVIPCQTFPIKDTLAELVADANALPDLQEGFVVLDLDTGKRMKVKGSSYIRIHRMRSSFSTKNFVEIIVAAEQAEVLAYFPEYKEIFGKIECILNDVQNSISEKYDQVKHIESQKEFALAIQDFEFKSCLFTARKNKTPATFRSISNEKILEHIISNNVLV